ncbi:hypothetical protein VTN31DRAFT_3016 [Thermomyces dupontii]|uniref:uncharacterized protein n=1 Tax=Talaromyces thermophilus TaxID=28565 RepID=UPI0037426489
MSSKSNGTGPKVSSSADSYAPNLTPAVINAMGPNTPPRARQVLAALIRHLHEFARETDLTWDEWFQGVKFLNSIGQASNEKRNEAHRISDILGLESLVDEISHKLAVSADHAPTSSAILGPFWHPNAPFRKNGDSIVLSPHEGQVALMHGTVTDAQTKKPIANAVIDIWQASSNGKYDFQDPENQVPNNLRGKFRTDANGYYRLYCLRPTAYSLPRDGPSWQLLQLMDRSPMRPAHIHLMVTHPKYHTLITQLYPDDDPHLKTDTVFAVKDDLVVHFSPLKSDPKASLELKYDISLCRKDVKTFASAKL